MDTWSIIAIFLVVPSLLFLISAAAVSGLRMSPEVVRSLLIAGLTLLPIAALFVWLRDQPWVGTPWDSIVGLVANIAGLIVAYAVIVGVAVAARRTLGLTNRCS